MNLVKAADSLDASTEASTEGSSPRHLAGVRSSLDLPQGFGVDLMLRYVSGLPGQRVDAYTEMDVLVSRHLTPSLELSLVGRNLLSPHHAEFAGGSSGTVEIQRSIYGRLVGRW